MAELYGKLARESGDLLRCHVCRSNAGYYIGTTDKDGFANTRESAEYYATQEEAQQALDDRTFTQRDHI